MDVLVAFGTGISYVYSICTMLSALIVGDEMPPYTVFDTSMMLVMFVSIGRYLENIAKGETSTALTKLMSLRPKEAKILLRDENDKVTQETSILADFVEEGDWVKVYPGENMPVDGIVIFGATSVDESMITGESLAVLKTIDSKVIAGTVNQTGVIHVKATEVRNNTTLSKIVNLVEQAQTSKAPIQAIADKVAGRFVPFVLVVGFCTFLFWLIYMMSNGIPSVFHKNETILSAALKMCIAVIVVACPCSLGLATPTALMVGTGVAAQHGILMKGGEGLEKAHKMTSIILDKTGTLTTGKMKVESVVSISKQFDREMVTQLVGLAEMNSEHSLGKAFVEYFKNHNHKVPSNINVLSFKSVPGSGLHTVIKINEDSIFDICLGNLKWLEQNNANKKENFEMELVRVIKFENEGFTVIWAAINKEIAGFVVFSDYLKPDSPLLINAFNNLNITSYMVTGDQRKTAVRFAQALGIPEERVIAEAKPEDKSNFVKSLQENGEIIGMVGDGVNDSPALATSDVGICVHSGTDIAIEAANMVLMRDCLMDVPIAIHLSRKIVKRIKMNFLWALIYNFIGIPIAAGCLVPIGISLPPWLASLMMALSSVSVICSSLLLKHYSPPKDIFQDALSSNEANDSTINIAKIRKWIFKRRLSNQGDWIPLTPRKFSNPFENPLINNDSSASLNYI
ncbi:heavy metal translocatin [Rozella allomycis CSF55]|nr:heavy metal translocatin [Rozella allomycis CSF55]